MSCNQRTFQKFVSHKLNSGVRYKNYWWPNPSPQCFCSLLVPDLQYTIWNLKFIPSLHVLAVFELWSKVMGRNLFEWIIREKFCNLWVNITWMTVLDLFCSLYWLYIHTVTQAQKIVQRSQNMEVLYTAWLCSENFIKMLPILKACEYHQIGYFLNWNATFKY